MNALRPPIFDHLESAQNVLIAGAGGGFDVFCGLPLYFALRDAGKTVHLANLTFSNLHGAAGRLITPALLEVTADSGGSDGYFPERYLAEWFRTQGENVPIYCLHRSGVRPLREAYQELTAYHGIDTVILVDGGTDSLMRGDEVGLGTPSEDMASIAAVDSLDLPRKILVCLGFGIDTFHGVCHAHVLEAVADLTAHGGFLGAFSLHQEAPAVQRYMEATRHVFAAMPHHVSIVSSSILSALEGRYGNHHATERTAGSRLWINPLMSLYWCCSLRAVAERVLYLRHIADTESFFEVSVAIADFRSQLPKASLRPWQQIPC
jgi:hypothetical protein